MSNEELKAGGSSTTPTNPVDDANNWNNNLGSTIGGFCTAIVQADAQAKDAAMARILKLLELPNAKFVADASLVGESDPLQVRIDAPVVALTRTDAVIIEEATIEMEMNVSSSVVDESTNETKGSGSGSASVGWGPFKAQIQVSASMASQSSHQRKSDFRSRTKCAVKMVQGEPSEGLSLIMETVNKFVDTASELNKQVVLAQLPALIKEAEGTKNVPPVAN